MRSGARASVTCPPSRILSTSRWYSTFASARNTDATIVDACRFAPPPPTASRRARDAPCSRAARREQLPRSPAHRPGSRGSGRGRAGTRASGASARATSGPRQAREERAEGEAVIGVHRHRGLVRGHRDRGPIWAHGRRRRRRRRRRRGEGGPSWRGRPTRRCVQWHPGARHGLLRVPSPPPPRHAALVCGHLGRLALAIVHSRAARTAVSGWDGRGDVAPSGVGREGDGAHARRRGRARRRGAAKREHLAAPTARIEGAGGVPLDAGPRRARGGCDATKETRSGRERLAAGPGRRDDDDGSRGTGRFVETIAARPSNRRPVERVDPPPNAVRRRPPRRNAGGELTTSTNDDGTLVAQASGIGAAPLDASPASARAPPSTRGTSRRRARPPRPPPARSGDGGDGGAVRLASARAPAASAPKEG